VRKLEKGLAARSWSVREDLMLWRGMGVSLTGNGGKSWT